ncbi:MAG TPA: MBL fold metallo-hydrolase [Candidatus Wallbacteria bacterium]|nr:MBL fold metallo-hydrolase [Candidatus Wallbacteria bacterium]
MKVKIWGSRGSIAVPGPYTLKYGGNTTCVEVITSEGQAVIIDAGSGFRLLGKKILMEKKSSEIFMIITHAHWDHLSGFPFFTPAYLERYTINVYGGPDARDFLDLYLKHQMSPPYFPVDFSHMKAKFKFGKDCPDTGEIGLIKISSIPLNHPDGGYGFKFYKQGKIFVFLTDNETRYRHPNGRTKEEYIEFCNGADLLIYDSQYTENEYKLTRGWGHSTFSDALEIGVAAGVKKLGFFHHDPDRTDADLDSQVELCRKRIKEMNSDVDCFGAAEGMEIGL